MADTPFTGLTASVRLGSSPEILCYISGVDLTLEKDMIEILAFGMTYKEKVPSIKDWSASIDGTVALAAGNTQKDLYDAFESGVALVIGIYLDDTTFFQGNGFVSSFNVSAAPDDKISLTSEIAGSGALLLNLVGVLGSLVVTSVPGGTAGQSSVTVSGNLGAGNKYMYKTAASVALPVYDEDVSLWTDWTEGQEIPSTDGFELVICEASSTAELAKKSGMVIANVM